MIKTDLSSKSVTKVTVLLWTTCIGTILWIPSISKTVEHQTVMGFPSFNIFGWNLYQDKWTNKMVWCSPLIRGRCKRNEFILAGRISWLSETRSSTIDDSGEPNRSSLHKAAIMEEELERLLWQPSTFPWNVTYIFPASAWHINIIWRWCRVKFCI